MSTEKMYIFMPYIENHMDMIFKFISEKKLDQETINDIVQKKEPTEKEIDLYLFTSDSSKIKDICHLQGTKDIKIANITLPKINEEKKRTIIEKAADYAINSLGMEEVFLKVDLDDTKTQDYLEQIGLELIGREKDYSIFLMEKDYKNESIKSGNKR